MSVVEIEIADDDGPVLTSAEDKAFEAVWSVLQGSTDVTARTLFDAGVDYVRNSEMVDSLIDKNGVAQLIVTNPAIVPAWMFRDMMLLYMRHLHDAFEVKHVNGDLNTKNYLECINSLEHVLNSAVLVDNSKMKVLDAFEKTRKKCEVILDDTI